jgi:glutamate-1-semialdehyde 2,1-aminomutase
MNKSNDLFDRARRSIPGGVNSPVRAFRSVKRNPLFIDRAKGCRVTDADGNTYIDFVGSWGPMIAGHANDDVIAAVQKALSKGTSFGAPTEGEVKLAERVVEMVPGVEMLRLVNSGTEATMSAVRLARGFTGRNKIIKFEGCYHGHGDSFLVKAGSGALTHGQPDSPGVPAALAELTLNAQFNDLASVEALIEANADAIAAIIIEPIAGNMGVILPQSGFLQGLRGLCDRHDIVLIFDEVMTGFRISPGGAGALYGVIPDLVTMGKVIGGGFPLAAYGGKGEIMAHLSPAGDIYQAGTLSGNPLAVAAGLQMLEIIGEDDFFTNLNRRSGTFFSTIAERIATRGWPLTLNYENSMGCLFFHPGPVSTYAQAAAADTEMFARFFNLLLDQQIYIAPSQYEALFISAAHGDADLDRSLQVMEKALIELYG